MIGSKGLSCCLCVVVCILAVVMTNGMVAEAKLNMKRSSVADDDFDIFVFALSWPGSACYTLKPCFLKPEVKDFTIHGLWPNKLVGKMGPFDCNAPAFNYSIIQDLRSDLDLYWTDYKNAAPGLWSHEYQKHGTCAAQLPQFATNPVRDYFVQSIKLRKTMSILPSLKKQNIIPSNTTSYDINFMKEGFKASGFGKPALVCYNGTILVEVRFCLNKELSFIDCPTQVGDQCKANSPIFFYKTDAPNGNDTALLVIGGFFGFVFLLLVCFGLAMVVRALMIAKKNYMVL